MAKLDTVVITARKDSFSSIFIAENAWYFIRMSDEMTKTVKYIAVYQTTPISAITHFAPIKEIITPTGTNKRKIIFSKKATELEKSIPLGSSPAGTIQGTRYTTFNKIEKAQEVADLF